ncbi:leucine-rich repeat domain-containing protein [Clostridium sp. AF34-13]|uniref:leucine-rich repeat protein n=1 Tax=Clostridium sp. AF34-13 TaxID=2293012 RepID=UPI0015FB2019|nr:leucine-rich repeat domain-containing protein [Clostridium sp. AF34-13]
MKKRVLALIMATAMLVTVCGGGQMLCRTVKAQMQKAYVIQNAAPLPTQTPSGGEREDFWCDSTRIKTNGDYKYHILSEEKKLITIRKIENANGKLEIPEEIDGYKVVGIGRSDRLPSRLGIAESEYEYSDFGLEEMSVLPESSGGVTEIIIPKYIQFVGICAFENCNSLKKVKINKRDVNLYLYGEAFLDCNKLESVNLPEKVCTDGDVFSCCGTIDEVTMGISMSTNADDSDCVFSGTNIKVLRFENKKKIYDISRYTNGKIGTIYLGKNVKKLILKESDKKYRNWEIFEIDKLLVEGKNTAIEGWNKKHLFLGKIYTVLGSKAVKWAKKNKIAYKVMAEKKIVKQIK